MTTIFRFGTKERMTLATAAALAIALAITFGASASSGSPPPPPSWVGANGIVDVSKMPQRLDVVNSNGVVVGTVDRDEYLRHTGDPLPVENSHGVVVGSLQSGGFEPSQ